MLSLSNLNYQVGKFSLGPINLELQSNVAYGLCGANGVGKSTLLRILSGVLKADTGEIYYHKKTIAPHDIFYIPQIFYCENSYLLVSEFLDDILTYRERNKDDRFTELSDKMKVTQLLGSNLAGVSGGESKRLLLFLATVLKPKILLLDEFEAHLDPKYKVELSSFLHDLKRDSLVISATHDKEHIKEYCDEILYLKDDRIHGPVKKDVFFEKHMFEEIYEI
ncbi:MAG: ATP-binding cassette domain-containing protein [Bacteriovoracaceae bacterium]